MFIGSLFFYINPAMYCSCSYFVCESLTGIMYPPFSGKGQEQAFCFNGCG